MTSTSSSSNKPGYLLWILLTLLLLTLPLPFHSQPSRLSPSRWRHWTIYKSSLIISNISYHSFSHSEALSCVISSPFSRTFNISLFYRPTSPTINSFLDEFSLFRPTITSNTIILGDFNIPNPPMIQSLYKLLTSFNLVQHVTSHIHFHGNTLDLIISIKTNCHWPFHRTTLLRPLPHIPYP